MGFTTLKKWGDLKDALQHVLDNEIINGGEYQINDGIKRMMSHGKTFKTGTVEQWMDCGNKKVTVETNAQVLDNEAAKGVNNVAKSAQLENTTIIPPCFIGENVQLTNTVVGPHVSLGANTIIENSVIRNSIVQHETHISNAVLVDSMIGSRVRYKGLARDLSLGDYTSLDE